jgi:hypothetical protein
MKDAGINGMAAKVARRRHSGIACPLFCFLDLASIMSLILPPRRLPTIFPIPKQRRIKPTSREL